ncbi:MAG: hypothetical protein R3222_06120, partial [Balneolaceae bacterium]|nr:hypothetical protein [Balneolaceae bacterium]
MTFLLLAIIFAGNSGFPEIFRPDSVTSDSSAQGNVRFMVLPILFSSPDTRLAGGVLPQVIFRTRSTDKPSSIRMDAYYTLNSQYHVRLSPTLWLKQGSMNITGTFSFKEWPTSFYGIGNNTFTDNQEKFSETLYETSVEATSHIGSDFYAGAGFSFTHSDIDPHKETG